MSRENSRDRSGGRSPTSDDEPQKILLLDASPGSSRKHGEGEDEVVHVPNFSKEISLDSEEDVLDKLDAETTPRTSPEKVNVQQEPKITVSPKGILKRKHPEKVQPINANDSPRNSKCCHPFVEKIKHIADITIHKVDKSSHKKDSGPKKRLLDEKQEILVLDCSPGTERRERQKLVGEHQAERESPEGKKISLVMQDSFDECKKENASPISDQSSIDPSPPSRKKKEHIYEDIEKDGEDEENINDVEMKSTDEKTSKTADSDTKSGDSKDPSLMIDEPMDEDSVSDSINKIKTMYDTRMTPDKLEVDIQNEVIISEPDESPSNKENGLSEREQKNSSPNITITEVIEVGLNGQHLNLDAQDENMDENVTALDKRVHFDMPDTTNEPSPVEEITPADGEEDMWSKISDHEYEPIGKPTTETSGPSVAIAPSGSGEHVRPGAAEEEGARGLTPPEHEEDGDFVVDDASSTTSQERQFLRPPPEEDNEAFSATDGEGDSHNAALLLQKQIEDRYFVNTPTTTESRTDCEISTSQVDSSAIEDLPLKRENRKKTSVGLETSKLQQRIKSQTGKIKSQAGKLRTKLKTMKKPQFNMPERPKFERPKFERPKFNLPERPKFNLPERPKFNLPDRPKINFPERPKFRLPDRPKISLPDKSKFHFPDRPKFSMPDRSKFKLPDRPKINFSTFSRNKDNKRENDDKTTESTSGSKKLLNFDFGTYPRIFSKMKKGKRGPTDSNERPGTPPPGFATVPRINRQQVVASKWEHASSRTTDDEPRHYGVEYSYDKEPDFQTKLAQVDKDFREMEQGVDKESNMSDKPARATIENKDLWNAMERSAVKQMEHGSSLPHILSANEDNENFCSSRADDDESSAASTGQHRRGVLEEIDNDEFFLRQKGISQDNIEVGKYLSNEIRDAFRSPVNALSQMDRDIRYSRDVEPDGSNMDLENNDNEFYKYKDEDDIEERLGYDADEINGMTENDDGYYTFPPVRPSRAKKLKALAQEMDNMPLITDLDADTEVHNIHLEEIPPPDIFSESNIKSFEPDKNLENFRKTLFGNSFKEPEILENLNEYENEMEQTREIPMIPKRRRKNPKDVFCSDSELAKENIDEDEWIDQTPEEETVDPDEIIVHRIEHIVPSSNDIEESPAIPQRTRSRSRGSRTTSIGDDDRTSRGAESLTLDSHPQFATVDLDFMDDLEDGPGYAIVDKIVNQRKDEPPPRPPAPMRRHRSDKSLSSDVQFFTVPRALKESTPPRRPLRNYSTLGPSRPPRKKSTNSLTALDDFQRQDSTDTTQYVEIENEDSEIHKDLKSGDVVSKMKDRPLPPPPRPPRGPKKKKDSMGMKDNEEDFLDSRNVEREIDFSRYEEQQTENENITVNIDSDTIVDNNNNSDFNNTSFDNVDDQRDDKIQTETENEEVIEIEVSTQTDPLPDDFDYELGMDEPLSENLECLPQSINDLSREEPEDNSIDVEIMSKGLQKFRESRPSSRASKTRTPIDRPKTPLGRISPTAILVERRVSSPTRINEREEIVTEASLTVRPIDEPYIPEPEHFAPVHQFYPTAPIPYQYYMPPLSASQNEQLLGRPDLAYYREETSPKMDTSQSVERPHISEVEVMKTQKLQVADLDVERLNVAELQAQKLLVSEVEGLSLHVSDLNSKSGQLYVRSLELAPGILEEILEKFSQMIPPSAPPRPPVVSTPAPPPENLVSHTYPKPDTNQETQTEPTLPLQSEPINQEVITHEAIQTAMDIVPPNEPPGRTIPSPSTEGASSSKNEHLPERPPQPPPVDSTPSSNEPPERPPLPQMHPSMYHLACYPEYSLPPASFYRLRNPPDRHQDDISDPEVPAPTRRRKHKREPVTSSEEEYRPVSRRAPQRPSEPSVSELSLQLFRACQNSVSRTVRHILSYITSHFGGGEDKKDVQMALIIFLVMIAGLIMLGIGDGRTVHHHHWDFFNPPNNEK